MHSRKFKVFLILYYKKVTLIERKPHNHYNLYERIFCVKQPGRIDILICGTTASLTVVFFVPFSLYLTNRDAFFTSPSAVAGILMAVVVAVSLAICVPVFFLKGKKRLVILSLLAFLAVAFWTQANLLNWNYGLLDGSALRWQLLERRTYIDVTA